MPDKVDPQPRLYGGSSTPKLDESLFLNPGAAYRGTPFWAWNNELVPERLHRQIDAFRRMGFGGFHMHARSGLRTRYLGEAFMSAVRDCVGEARKTGMLAWLYDEDRWPSGYGGGFVTQEPEFRLKYLLFTATAYNGTVRPTPNWSCALAGRLENGRLLARYGVRLDEAGCATYRRLAEGEAVAGDEREWFAYLESAEGVPWFNNQTYVDTLNPAAIERFTQVCHEEYKRCVGGDFGTTVPCIFTDEPQHLFKQSLATASDAQDRVIPATGDFFDSYSARWGEDLLDHLPELFWELPEGLPSRARYRYHEQVTTRFAGAYAGTLGRWCERNGLLLTGHMMEEPTLESQTRATGEAMRSLARLTIPGVDMLCDDIELTTVKQAQSVARQYGRPGVMSELYGVTGWGFDFAGHKRQGDWQAALGVTLRVPHLAWLSMQGESKRDFPACIGDQSPWADEYRVVEDHFARVNVAMTRGKPLVRIGVIHPIESYWLRFGPLDQTAADREALEHGFLAVTEGLLGQLLDFDYISEGLLPELCPTLPQAAQLPVGEMRYDAIVVPPMRTMRQTTLDRLAAFAASGGKLVFVGPVPNLVDAQPCARVATLAGQADVVPVEDLSALYRLLEPFRVVGCADRQNKLPQGLLYQLREDGSERHLFICNTDRNSSHAGCTLDLAGCWRVFERDTADGGICEVPAHVDGGWTKVSTDFEAHGHKLLTLRPGEPVSLAVVESLPWRVVSHLAERAPVTLSEPNVLLLDKAEWRWNSDPWQPAMELLRLHNTLREQCGLRPREAHIIQPWADDEPVNPLGVIELRFKIEVSIAITAPELAVEEPARWRFSLNGTDLPQRDTGYWVDESIRRIALPALPAGTHELVLSRTFDRKTELEWCYLLGDFGVQLNGSMARLTAPVRELGVGDWTAQGLPFYAGNVTYHFDLPTVTGDTSFALCADRFSAALLKADFGDGVQYPMAFAPFRVTLPRQEGETPQKLALTAYGNRHNAFGPLHNSDPQLRWIGPDAWDSRGDLWTDGYRLMPMGLIEAPRIETR